MGALQCPGAACAGHLTCVCCLESTPAPTTPTHRNTPGPAGALRAWPAAEHASAPGRRRPSVPLHAGTRRAGCVSKRVSRPPSRARSELGWLQGGLLGESQAAPRTDAEVGAGPVRTLVPTSRRGKGAEGGGRRRQSRRGIGRAPGQQRVMWVGARCNAPYMCAFGTPSTFREARAFLHAAPPCTAAAARTFISMAC